MNNKSNKEKINKEKINWLEIYKNFKKPFVVHWRIMDMPRKEQGFDTRKPYRMLAYITSRDVMDRLDETVGVENWFHDFEYFTHTYKNGALTSSFLKVSLTVLGVTKHDVGILTNIQEHKGAISDGFKRAAVQFGIGRFLYNVEPVYVYVNQYGMPANETEKRKLLEAQKKINALNKDDVIVKIGDEEDPESDYILTKVGETDQEDEEENKTSTLTIENDRHDDTETQEEKMFRAFNKLYFDIERSTTLEELENLQERILKAMSIEGYTKYKLQLKHKYKEHMERLKMQQSQTN